MSNAFPTTANNTEDLVNSFAQDAQTNQVTASQARANYLKFSGKTGRWEMGKDEEDFEGVEVFINPLEAQHGFVRWGVKPPMKTHTKRTTTLPAAMEPFNGVDPKGQPKTYYAQPSRILSGVTSDEMSDPFILELSSQGGVENVDKLWAAIMVKAASSKYFFPIVRLENEYWTHSEGKVFKPVFEISEWRNVNGDSEDATPKLEAAPKVAGDAQMVVEEAEVVEAPAKKKRTRKARA